MFLNLSRVEQAVTDYVVRLEELGIAILKFPTQDEIDPLIGAIHQIALAYVSLPDIHRQVNLILVRRRICRLEREDV